MSSVCDLRAGSASRGLARARHAHALVRAGSVERALVVTRIEDDARLVGRFASERDALRRQSGGPPWQLRSGVTFVHLSLAHRSVLMPTPKDKLLNRNVRPMLAALRKTGALTMYGGRDFLLVDGDIVALLGWAVARSGEVVLEAAITTDAPVLPEDEAPAVRAGHLHKRERIIAPEGVHDALRSAYAPEAEAIVLDDTVLDDAVQGERPLAGSELASIDVALGNLALHRTERGLHLFGDLLASDAIDALELDRLAALPIEARREALRASGCEVDGVRDFADVVAALLEHG